MSASLPRSAASDRSPWLIATIVSIATFMEVLDTTIANVALRHMAGGVGASQDESTWILTTYLVTNAIVLPVSGYLATALGRKRFYMGCAATFTLASLGCTLSPNLGALLICRAIQGIGGGGLAPVEQSILADTFPPEKRSQAFALYGLTVVTAPAMGPALGGWITDNSSRHWIFLINIPVGALSLLLISIFVREPPAGRPGWRGRASPPGSAPSSRCWTPSGRGSPPSLPWRRAGRRSRPIWSRSTRRSAAGGSRRPGNYISTRVPSSTTRAVGMPK